MLPSLFQFLSTVLNNLIKALIGVWKTLAERVGQRTMDAVFITITVIVTVEVFWLTIALTFWFFWLLLDR